MDLKSILVKFIGGFVFSYGLIGAIAGIGVALHNSIVSCTLNNLSPARGAGTCFSNIVAMNPFTYWISILVMAVGLVLLAYEFFPATSKAKK